MSEHRGSPASELATGIAATSAGFGIITMALFPISIGGLLLFVIAPVALVIAPFVLIPLLALLLAAPFLVLLRGR